MFFRRSLETMTESPFRRRGMTQLASTFALEQEPQFGEETVLAEVCFEKTAPEEAKPMSCVASED